jgi:cytochrome c
MIKEPQRCIAERRPGGLALAIAVALTAAPVAAQDGGEALFNNACRTCHTLEAGDNRLGPTLHGVVGRQAGSLPGYNFSQALKRSGVVWDEANLDSFIEKPDALIPGNNMKPYTGMTSTEDRAAIIGYLAAQAGGTN